MNKPRFNIEDYQGKYAMHCETEVKAAIFCGYMDSVGRAWFDGTSYVEDMAYDYSKNDTAYTLDDMSRGHWQGLERCGYTILEFDDFDWSISRDEAGRYFQSITKSLSALDDRISRDEENRQQEAKADTGKPRCDLVSPALILAVGAVRGYGTEKYGSDSNWEVVETNRYVAALLRHLCAYMRDPKSKDEESGLYHLFHAACNINFLVDRLDKEKEPI